MHTLYSWRELIFCKYNVSLYKEQPQITVVTVMLLCKVSYICICSEVYLPTFYFSFLNSNTDYEMKWLLFSPLEIEIRKYLKLPQSSKTWQIKPLSVFKVIRLPLLQTTNQQAICQKFSSVFKYKVVFFHFFIKRLILIFKKFPTRNWR